MEGDLGGTGTAGVTAPGRATEHLATGARHATRAIPGAGETLTEGVVRETVATERLDTEMVCGAVARYLGQREVLTFSKILAEGPHRPGAATALPRQTYLTEAEVAVTGPT